jgi:L-arabinose transport system permease protein
VSGPGTFATILDQAGMLLILGLLFVICYLFVPNFRSFYNMSMSLPLSVSTVGIVACTMLFCLASGNFDLSVGTMIPCAGVMAAIVTVKTGSYTLGVAAALLTGLAVGFFNGFIVAICRINPLITTLATMQIVKTITLKICDQRSVGVANQNFFLLGSSSFLGIQTPIWICILCFVFFGFLLGRTTFGRNTLAIGGNEEAARLAGIAVARTKLLVFAMQGLMAAFAGVVLAARMKSGQPKVAEGFELEVIAACVLGGVSLTGGVGRISFVIAGVLIMGIVQNAMGLLNIGSEWQYGVRGGILLAAVLFDRFKQRRIGH